jgi:purine-binding chemotaxis protein CheW
MSDQKEKEITKTDVKEALMNLLNSSASGGAQYVTFTIGDEDYGIEIQKIQEITAFRELTFLPNTPDYVLGILNLRGNVIPVMDPRIRFGLETVDHNSKSVVILFNTQGKTVGMVVDSIRDVLTIDDAHVEETPDLAHGIDSQFIRGMGKISDHFVIILDIDKIFKEEQIEQVEAES